METEGKSAVPGEPLDDQELNEATGGFGMMKVPQHCPQCGDLRMADYIIRDCYKCGYQGKFKPGFP